MAIRRDKFKLITGVPMTLTIEDPRGTDTTSSFTGDETRFSVTNGTTPGDLYLPRAYANILAQIDARPGDEVQFLKTGTNGQPPTYRARLVSDAHLAVERERPQDVRATRANAPDQPAFSTGTTPAQPIRMLAPRAQAVEAPPVRHTVAQQAAEATPLVVQILGQCLLEAVDVALGCERYAAGKGKTLVFNEEDIRAIGATLFIQRSKN